MALKVNVDKVLADYNALAKKQETKLAEIEVEARAYAQKRGFDEDKTLETIDMFQTLEDNGLSGEDADKFNLLDEYIDEVEDAPVEEKAEEKPVEQAANPTAPNPAKVNVV